MSKLDLNLDQITMDFDPLNDGYSIFKIYSFLKTENAQLDFESAEAKEKYIKYLDDYKPILESTLELSFENFNEFKVHVLGMSNNADDQYFAGMCFLLGIKVKRDFNAAYLCFLRSAQRKNKEAAHQLSVMILNGLVEGCNLELWLKVLGYAVGLGDKNAIDQWKDLEQAAGLINELKEEEKVAQKKTINYGALFTFIVGVILLTTGIFSLIDAAIAVGLSFTLTGSILFLIGMYALFK